SLAGVAAGFVVYLVAVVTGITAVFSVVPAAYAVVKLAGAGYLLWLAWGVVRPGGGPVFAPGEPVAEGAGRLFSMGLVTSLLNPKIAVLYVSLLPQFVDPARGGVAVQSLVLGLTQIVVAVSFNAMFVMVAGSVAKVLDGRPVWVRVQRYVMGTVLGGLAVHLALGRAPAPG
ncbi:LysE family translocator, partial [Planomonospora corallina]